MAGGARALAKRYRWTHRICQQRNRLGRTETAVAALEHAVHTAPQAAAMHNNLGYLLGQLGALDRAIEHAEQAVRLGGNHQLEYPRTLAELSQRRSSLQP